MDLDRWIAVCLLSGGVGWGIFNWKSGVRLTVIVIVLEGALRKWCMPEQGELIYFLRDASLLGAAIGFLRSYGVYAVWQVVFGVPFIVRWLTILCISYGLVQIFNPYLADPLAGLFGFKVYFFNILLLLLISKFWNNLEEFRQDCFWVTTLLIPLGVLAGIQHYTSYESVLNRYSNIYAPVTAQGIGATGSMLVRSTATFSYISGYSAFLALAMIMASWFYILSRPISQRDLLILGLAIFSAIIGAGFTGGRAAFMLVIFIALIIGAILFWDHRNVLSRIGKTKLWIFIVMLIVGVSLLIIPTKLSIYRFSSDDTLERIQNYVLFFKTKTEDLYWIKYFGAGIGTTHPGQEALRKKLNPTNNIALIGQDEEKYRVAREIGIAGFFLWISMKSAVVGLAIYTGIKVKDNKLRGVVFMAMVYLLMMLPDSVCLNYVINFGFWLNIAIVIWIFNFQGSSLTNSAMSYAKSKN
jgi:hypothetical protein